jgi:hypothetical protein
MPGSIIAENSAGAASKAKEVTLPVYADDLATMSMLVFTTLVCTSRTIKMLWRRG